MIRDSMLVGLFNFMIEDMRNLICACPHFPTSIIVSMFTLVIPNLVVLGIMATTPTSTLPVDEDSLSKGILASFVRIACMHSPGEMPNIIPPACGPGAPKHLCQWARLSEDRFIELASERVKGAHAYAKRHPLLQEGFRQNMDALHDAGLDEDDAEVEMIKRYRIMLRAMKECQSVL